MGIAEIRGEQNEGGVGVPDHLIYQRLVQFLAKYTKLYILWQPNIRNMP